MKVYNKVDNAESISGVGIVKEQIYDGTKNFNLYGSLYNFLTADEISDIAVTANQAIKGILCKFPKVQLYSEVAGYLAEVVTEFGLNALKKMCGNKKLKDACAYFIMMMKYCRQDLPRTSDFITDSTVESVLSALPLERSKASNLYGFYQPKSIRDLPSVNFNDEQRQCIGYFLYYLFQSRGLDCLESRKVRESFSKLYLQPDIVVFYRDYYERDLLDNSLHIQCVKQIFEGVSFEKYDINPQYVKRVTRKLGEYYPHDGSAFEKIIEKGPLFTEIFTGKKEDIFCNILSVALAFIFDGYQGSRDNVTEEFMNDIKRKYGYDMGNYGDQVYRGAKDDEDIIHG